MEEKSQKRLLRSWSEKLPWIVGSFLALSVGLAANGIQELIDAWIGSSPLSHWKKITNWGYIGTFTFLTIWLYRIRGRFFQPRTRYLKNEPPEKREHLILFLSNLPKRGKFVQGIPEGVELTGDFDKDLESSVEWKQREQQNWPWEMVLRGIRHHIKSGGSGRGLQTVTLLCSTQSIGEVHWCRQILARYSELNGVRLYVFVRENEKPVLVECPQSPSASAGWDFERFDELSEAMAALLSELGKQGVQDEQIMIDFTGGQKVTSVVAATMTFNRKMKAQYVQTNHPYEVVSYDILLGSSETSGLGV